MTDRDHTDDPAETQGVRLQKVLAQAGVGSRRACEILIDEGRVEVNRRVVTEQGVRIDPDRDVVHVDGSRIPPPRRHAYLAFNKPRGVVSTMDDPEGRPTVTDYLPGRSDRLFHVGRLDTDTEGLLLLTNDGDFAHKLAHPSYEVPKTYLAQVTGVMDRATVTRLRKGITLPDGPVRPDRLKVVSRAADKCMVEIVLHEGRNHIVRRMLEAMGHPVRRLARTAVGPVQLGRLPVGETKELSREELGALLELLDRRS
ncbi:pseudouridine synthase [Propionibacteriaceae bacterium Y2011]|uniref:pseudouridine synthase n=1 Tax=Microlunatus sp. Y2014 TaxID=3418488 RepID=UPI003B4DCBDC